MCIKQGRPPARCGIGGGRCLGLERQAGSNNTCLALVQDGYHGVMAPAEQRLRIPPCSLGGRVAHWGAAPPGTSTGTGSGGGGGGDGPTPSTPNTNCLLEFIFTAGGPQSPQAARQHSPHAALHCLRTRTPCCLFARAHSPCDCSKPPLMSRGDLQQLCAAEKVCGGPPWRTHGPGRAAQGGGGSGRPAGAVLAGPFPAGGSPKPTAPRRQPPPDAEAAVRAPGRRAGR